MWPFKKKDNTPLINQENIHDLYEKLGRYLFNGNVFLPLEKYKEQNDNVLVEMYESIPEVAAPINYTIEKAASIKLVHQRKKGDKWIDIENSKVYDVLNTPNQYDNQDTIRKNWMLNYIVLGNSFLNYIKPAGFQYVKQLYVFPSNIVTIKTNKNIYDFRQNEVTGYSIKLENGQTMTLSVDEIIHTRQQTLGKKGYLRGRSKLMSAIYTSESLRANYEARVRIYEARGMMGILSPKNENVVFRQEDAEAVQKKLIQKFGVTKNKDSVLTTSVPLKYTNTSPDIKGLMLNENKQQDYETVCSVLSFPPVLLINKTSTYNNISTAETMFYTNTCMPLNMLEAKAYEKAFRLPANERIVPDYSEIEALQKNYESISRQLSTMWNDGVIDENEYRTGMGFDESKEGTRRNETQNVQP